METVRWRVTDSMIEKLNVELAVAREESTHDLFICLCLKPESF
jgi:hypothetical protein